MILRPARLTTLTVFLFVSLLCSQCFAQSPGPVPGDLPDAPSSAQQADKSAQAPAAGDRKQSSLEIIIKRSRFFPDLATNREPLSAGGKFKLFVSDSISPAVIVGSLFAAGIGQATDSYPGYGQGGEGFAKRFGASMGRASSSQFFGTFLLASMLHQDPRYFPIQNATLKQSVRHALRRIVITHTDHGGEAPNFSGLMGPLAAEGLANTYLPESERTAGKTFQRYGIDIAARAGANIMKEYWPTIFKRLRQKPGQKN
jgi:hypothetical protein